MYVIYDIDAARIWLYSAVYRFMYTNQGQKDSRGCGREKTNTLWSLINVNFFCKNVSYNKNETIKNITCIKYKRIIIKKNNNTSTYGFYTGIRM